METKLVDIPLNNIIMNAAGCACTDSLDLSLLHSSKSGAIVTKSCTISSRKGNEETRYYQNDSMSLSSIEQSNLGYPFYENWILKNNSKEKPVIFSIAGQTPVEMQSLMERIDAKFSAQKNVLCEVNVSCPNVKGGTQTGYDFDALNEILRKIMECKESSIGIGVKLPPYFEPFHFSHVGDILINNNISFLTSINSIGNGMLVDWNKESSILRPNSGLGGIGGKICKPLGLSNVYQFYREVGDKIDIIGCGGVENGSDVFEYILAGAKAVQIGTQLYREKPKQCFDRISDELELLLKTKGYSCIEHYHAKLHEKPDADADLCYSL
jgi:dihydroorotate dehydrogenase (fumarate)